MKKRFAVLLALSLTLGVLAGCGDKTNTDGTDGGNTTESQNESAIACATASVPAASVGFSNTPMGPFQTTVLDALTASANSFMVSGPMSQPSMSAGIAVTGTTVVSTGASMGSGKSLMQTASTGSSSLTPFSLAIL